MINLQPQVIEAYLTDSVNKEVVINGSHVDGLSLEDVNYYVGGITDTNYISYRRSGTFNTIQFYSTDDITDTVWRDKIEFDYVDDHDCIVIAFKTRLNVVSGSLPNNATWYLRYFKKNDPNTFYSFNLGSADMATLTGDDISTVVFNFLKPSDIGGIYDIYIDLPSPATAEFDTRMDAVQVNFTDDVNYIPAYSKAPDFSRFDPEDYGGYVINNDRLLYEDFRLTESLCSKDNIKFGLCEAAHCEFSEIGSNSVKVGDVLNTSIYLPDAITISDADLFAINWVNNISYTWHMWNTNADLYYWWRITASLCADYGEYLDKLNLRDKRIYYQFKLKVVFNNLSGNKPTYLKYRFRNTGDNLYFTSAKFYDVSDFDNQFGLISESDPITFGAYTVQGFNNWEIRFYDENKNAYPQGAETFSYDFYMQEVQYRIGYEGNVMPAWSSDDRYVALGTLDAYLKATGGDNSIPLGIFKVSSVENEYRHNLVKKKITAYDNLLTLENNAADWYTRYMFGVDFYGFTDAGFEYARQIFSTYWNYVTSVGLDSIDNYELTDFTTLNDSDFICDSSSCYGYVRWDMGVGNYYYRSYAGVDVPITDNTLLYRVTYGNYGGFTDEAIINAYNPHYVESGFDTMLRGFGTIGGVLIEEYRTGEAIPYNRICVNRGDFFMLSPDTTSIKVVLPSGSKNALGYSLCQDITLQTAPRRQDLTNGHLRLCYYNYDQKTIFACDSSITGRDVVRSLLEVCGCFFRLDRYNGLPEFVYPTQGGLYPSNTLYPADDLYPRTGTDQLYSMGKYISVIAENYEVKNYGRIQILKRIKSSDTQSVVEWQYEGDPDMENTYIIDDNIFYCAEEMEYDYDGMPEVAAMLEGMWGVISNLGYFPNVTQALGAPWLECGDRVGLLTYDGGFETFVFRRTLKGIQNLRDTYESEGDEITPAISNFGYTV